MDAPPHVDSSAKLAVAWYVIIAAVGLAGNSVTIVVLFGSANRIKPAQTIILWLAIVDLLGCLFLPLRYKLLYYTDQFYIIIFCYIAKACCDSLLYIGLLLITLSAYERYHALKNINEAMGLSKIKALIVISVCVLSGVVFSAVQIVIPYLGDLQDTGNECQVYALSYVHRLVSMMPFCILTIVVVVLYAKIARLLKRRMKPNVMVDSLQVGGNPHDVSPRKHTSKESTPKAVTKQGWQHTVPNAVDQLPATKRQSRDSITSSYRPRDSPISPTDRWWEQLLKEIHQCEHSKSRQGNRKNCRVSVASINLLTSETKSTTNTPSLHEPDDFSQLTAHTNIASTAWTPEEEDRIQLAIQSLRKHTMHHDGSRIRHNVQVHALEEHSNEGSESATPFHRTVSQRNLSRTSQDHPNYGSQSVTPLPHTLTLSQRNLSTISQDPPCDGSQSITAVHHTPSQRNLSTVSQDQPYDGSQSVTPFHHTPVQRNLSTTSREHPNDDLQSTVPLQSTLSQCNANLSKIPQELPNEGLESATPLHHTSSPHNPSHHSPISQEHNYPQTNEARHNNSVGHDKINKTEVPTQGAFCIVNHEDSGIDNTFWQQIPGVVVNEDDIDLRTPPAGMNTSIVASLRELRGSMSTSHSQNLEDQEGVRSPVYIKVRTTLLIASVVCVLSYGTYSLSILLGPKAAFIAQNLIIINHACNPFIYSIVNESFREHCVSLLCRLRDFIRNF